MSRASPASGPTASTICCAAHSAVGCAVTFTWITRLRSGESTKKTYNTPNVTVGTVRKSIAIVPTAWVRMNVPHVWDGGRGGRPAGRGMYFATASLPTSWPSFASSFAIRRRLQSGFSRAIRTMSATTSGARGRRPARLGFQAQKRAKPRRCHAITVAGFTRASASAHRDQTRETPIQKARSIGRSYGRGLSRLNTASCCRSTRISTTRLARGRKAAMSAPSRAETIANTTGDGDADRGVRHGRIAPRIE